MQKYWAEQTREKPRITEGKDASSRGQSQGPLCLKLALALNLLLLQGEMNQMIVLSYVSQLANQPHGSYCQCLWVFFWQGGGIIWDPLLVILSILLAQVTSMLSDSLT